MARRSKSFGLSWIVKIFNNMNKEELKKQINETIEKHLDLIPDIYTSPINDCQHKSWGYIKGMLRKTKISCPDCKLEIDDPKVIDFVEKFVNNDKKAIKDTLKRIEFFIDDCKVGIIFITEHLNCRAGGKIGRAGTRRYTHNALRKADFACDALKCAFCRE